VAFPWIIELLRLLPRFQAHLTSYPPAVTGRESWNLVLIVIASIGCLLPSNQDKEGNRTTFYLIGCISSQEHSRFWYKPLSLISPRPGLWASLQELLCSHRNSIAPMACTVTWLPDCFFTRFQVSMCSENERRVSSTTNVHVSSPYHQTAMILLITRMTASRVWFNSQRNLLSMKLWYHLVGLSLWSILRPLSSLHRLGFITGQQCSNCVKLQI
jgi:hypothetical protein